MSENEINKLEARVLQCLKGEQALAQWWTRSKKSIAGIKVSHFCDAVRGLVEKERIVLAEGIPDPFFGVPERIDEDERDTPDQINALLDRFDQDFFADDFFD